MLDNPIEYGQRRDDPEMIDYSSLYPALRDHLEAERQEAQAKVRAVVVVVALALVIFGAAFLIFKTKYT